MTNSPQADVHYKKLIACILLGIIWWFLPTPDGMQTEGWHVLAVFVVTILALIIKPLPMAVTTLVAMTILIVTNTIPLGVAIGGFSSQPIWLMLIALFVAQGFVVTTLGKRLALIFTRLFGKSTIGLSYGLAFTDFLLAPAIPSVTARSAGIIFPILQGIATTYESYPHSPSARKIGGFITVTAFQITCITSAMFLTAMAANPLLASLTAQQGYELSWGTWATAGILPGLVSLILIPWLIYLIYPPEIRHTPKAAEEATAQLKALGRFSLNEMIMAGTALLLIALWIFGDKLHINALTTALLGLSILLITGVLRLRHILEHHTAWETYIWFAILVMIAGRLGDTGIISWFSERMVTPLQGYHWQVAFPALLLVYFYSHYFFASSTAHVSSMYVPILVVSIMLGTPPMLAILSLIFASNLFGGLTHYSLAPAPFLYGAGYVPLATWWKIGFLVSIANLLIWGLVGGCWWHILGLW